jgi:hypothetical protein
MSLAFYRRMQMRAGPVSASASARIVRLPRATAVDPSRRYVLVHTLLEPLPCCHVNHPSMDMGLADREHGTRIHARVCCGLYVLTTHAAEATHDSVLLRNSLKV